MSAPEYGTAYGSSYGTVDGSSYDVENELLTGEAVALQLRATSVVLRAVGGTIDYLIYGVATALLLWLVLDTAPALGVPENLMSALGIVTATLGLVIAPAVIETATQGKSLGRAIVGDRIVRDDGGAIAFRHAFIRSFVGLFEIVLTAGGLAVLVAIVNVRAKRLGDLLAGTYSQYERVPAAEAHEFDVPVELAEWALTADVARLPDVLARRIRQFLGQASRHTPATRARIAATLARDASVHVSPVPSVDPELFLAGVAVLRRDREAAALAREAAQLEALAPALTSLPHGFPDRG
jgi:uncharacterized RDD family membrane protein YckC